MKGYFNFYSYVAIGNAMISKQQPTDGAFKKLCKTGVYGAYFLFAKKKRLDQHEMVNANPDLSLARELWNLMENKWVQKGIELVLPNVKLNKKIWVPMCDEVITRDNVHKLKKFIKIEGDGVQGWKVE